MKTEQSLEIIYRMLLIFIVEHHINTLSVHRDRHKRLGRTMGEVWRGRSSADGHTYGLYRVATP
jgi:hypothetical protein